MRAAASNWPRARHVRSETFFLEAKKSNLAHTTTLLMSQALERAVVSTGSALLTHNVSASARARSRFHVSGNTREAPKHGNNEHSLLKGHLENQNPNLYVSHFFITINEFHCVLGVTAKQAKHFLLLKNWFVTWDCARIEVFFSVPQCGTDMHCSPLIADSQRVTVTVQLDCGPTSFSASGFVDWAKCLHGSTSPRSSCLQRALQVAHSAICSTNTRW